MGTFSSSQSVVLLETRKLSWDSSFFERDVYFVEVGRAGDLDTVRDLVKPCLIYVFLNSENESLKSDLEKKGAFFCGTRLVYYKRLGSVEELESKIEIRAYDGPVNEDLESLVYLAGSFSRFRKDVRMSRYFKPLFEEWLVKSLRGEMADRTFVHESRGRITGFITCSIKNSAGRLGLISVSKSKQSTGIGSALLSSVERYYKERQIFDSYIVTQYENYQACSFYESLGYTIHQRTYVYHWWCDL